jgi:hypothetical protein
MIHCSQGVAATTKDMYTTQTSPAYTAKRGYLNSTDSRGTRAIQPYSFPLVARHRQPVNIFSRFHRFGNRNFIERFAFF